EVDAEVYHLHDPELLRIALKLKRKGKIVIYDAHEDLPRQILGKYWIPKMLRKLLSYSFEQYEDYIVKRLDAVVAATPFIKERFEKINKNVIDVNNYPILVKDEVKQLQSKGNYLCYAGGISANRGILDLIKAMDLLPDLKLKLAGRYSPEEFRKELTLVEGWGSVEELGYITRQEIRQLIKGSIVGLVTLKPLPNYLDSLPIKMFEYMYEGIPVIASNFPLWKKIVEGNKCGVCVNPESPKEIAEAVKMFVENPNMAAEMGKNGREMVWNKYNWTIEEGKLIALYKSLLLK
ncbi:MAG: glycosyltransferase involved in cell wall biosynthesis, partial [Saprospiraceae bacterium]